MSGRSARGTRGVGAQALWVFLFITLFAQLSCGEGAKSAAPDKKPSHAEAQEAARRWLDALGARDPERLGAATAFPFWSFGLGPEAEGPTGAAKEGETGACSTGLGVGAPKDLPVIAGCLFQAKGLLDALSAPGPAAEQSWKVINKEEIPKVFGGRFSASPFSELSGALGRLARRHVFVAARISGGSVSFFLLLAVSKEEGGARVSAVVAAPEPTP